MDPATILGTTSAILSFVQFAGKVISVAWKIHGSADGVIDDNQSLEEAVNDLQTRLESLQPTGKSSCSNDPKAEASAAKTDAEKSLLRTARECAILGNKILEILNKTKAKAAQADEKQSASLFRRAQKHFRKDDTDGPVRTSRQPSLVQGIRASIQTVWQKDKIDALRQKMGGLRDPNEHGLPEQSQISKLECLQSFLDDFKEADTLQHLEKRNIECILRALEFEGMNARRQQVESTVGSTFKWFVTDDTVPDGHPDLKVSFTKWLRDGTGIYHVTGKPGSGKSTLMKLIDQAATTREQLEGWASRTRERLIIARFYTWKAANAHHLQNQEEGLTRTLLHQILTAAPELTRIVFAKHSCWKPQEYRLIDLLSRGHGVSAKIRFESREILAALESIFRVQGYRLFLLIDGMDEFEKAHNHRAIAEQVLTWVSDGFGRVKICVSSREDNAFMDKFSVDQRLRLHVVTENDVRELVTTRLMENDHFAAASIKNRLDLIDTIVEQARGVFLWVVLTIQELKPLLDDCQSFQMLSQAVYGFPQEMGEFLQEILDRIPAIYKKESAAILCVATSEFAGTGFLCLFDYSMLRKCLELEDSNLDKESQHMTLEEVVTQLQDFRARLPSLCKGLLEITLGAKFSNLYGDVHDRDQRATIECTHRSVFDFLRSLNKGSPVARDADRSFEARGEILAIRSVIEVTKAIPWNEIGSTSYEFYLDGLLHILSRGTHFYGHVGASIFPLLMTLDAVILRKQGAIAASAPFNPTIWKDIRLDVGTVFLFFTAVLADYHQYIDWALENYPPWILTQEAKALFVDFYLSLIYSQVLDYRLYRVYGKVFMPVRCLRKGGWFSINEPILATRSPIPSFSLVLRGSIWLHFLVATMLTFSTREMDSMRWVALMEALSAGAEPRIRFKWWSQEQAPDTRQDSTREAEPVQMEPKFSDVRDSHRSGAQNDREMPFGSQFGMTVEVGDSLEPQQIQGPQWPGEEDTRLIRFFVKSFGKPSGSATMRDVLEIMLKPGPGAVGNEEQKRHCERCLQAVDDALVRVGTLPTMDMQSISPASGDPTENCQYSNAVEPTGNDRKDAQQVLIPSGDNPLQLSWLGPENYFHDWQTAIISSLGRSHPFHPWLSPSARILELLTNMKQSFWGSLLSPLSPNYG